MIVVYCGMEDQLMIEQSLPPLT